uniref:Uncharacterized protein n=1 Tax=Rhizophora mucronata TaxID=61149 RepID=A0A2P2MS11_RHIMU
MIGYIKIALLVQISSTALVLDEIINHVQYLQRQVEVRFPYLKHHVNLNGKHTKGMWVLGLAGIKLYTYQKASWRGKITSNFYW